MAELFRIPMEVRWADLDINWHLRNTAFIEFAIHTRLTFFTRHGFTAEDLQRLGFGPVVFREEMKYRREARFGQTLMISLRLAGLSDDGSHWEIQHDVDHENGQLSATMRVEGAWMNITERTLTRPPSELHSLLAHEIVRTDDFRTLPSVVKG